MDFDISFGGAFIAGLISFISPCVLPIVPPYLCYLAGVSLDQLTESEGSKKAGGQRVFFAALAFVLGFATVFVALGATASVIGKTVTQYLDTLSIIAGVIIIIMGLHFLGIFRIGMLYREARVQIERKPAGLFGSYIVGLAFAFGWTPCVGPVLAAILFVAGTEDSAMKGATLLFSYSMGIGLPFLAAALFASPFMKFMARFKKHMGTVEKVMGAMLVVTGLLFVTGQMATMSYWLLEAFPALGRVG
jgi:cytochrome c-type biogenesis protein